MLGFLQEQEPLPFNKLAICCPFTSSCTNSPLSFPQLWRHIILVFTSMSTFQVLLLFNSTPILFIFRLNDSVALCCSEFVDVSNKVFNGLEGFEPECNGQGF